MHQTFAIATMGCQMNACDSDYLAQILLAKGFHPAEGTDDADIVLINTCSVRAKPEHKARSLIGRVAARKKRRPGIVLAVVGCLAQHKAHTLAEEFPQIDILIGPRELERFGVILDAFLAKGERILATEVPQGFHRNPVPRGDYFADRVSGFVSIMEGCNNYCTYCIVPYVRGPEDSRPLDEVVAEVEHLLRQGIREITLLGQNVNSYHGRNGSGFSTFSELLHVLDELPDLLRLRFTTSHPKDLSADLIQCFSGQLPSVCPHLHLPFQAGSNRILAQMNRRYTREQYLDLVHRLRQECPGIALTSDVMVGFPGETEEDFRLTLDLIEQVQFETLFSFRYSDRDGTRASNMTPKVEESRKAAWLQKLQGLQQGITLRKHRRLEGQVLDVLVEGPSRKNPEEWQGRTGTNIVVNFPGQGIRPGNLVRTRIVEGHMNSLRGERVGA